MELGVKSPMVGRKFIGTLVGISSNSSSNAIFCVMSGCCFSIRGITDLVGRPTSYWSPEVDDGHECNRMLAEEIGLALEHWLASYHTWRNHWYIIINHK